MTAQQEQNAASLKVGSIIERYELDENLNLVWTKRYIKRVTKSSIWFHGMHSRQWFSKKTIVTDKQFRIISF